MRTYTTLSNQTIQQHLNTLIDEGVSVCAYQNAMTSLGYSLAEKGLAYFSDSDEVLLVSTSEDADYLTLGYANALKEKGIAYKIAVFWNHHYVLPSGESVAPITQRYLEPNYQSCNKMVLLKSIISGSCVIRTNFLALLESMKPENLTQIVVAAPVRHNKSEENLKKEFPNNISNKFVFMTFAIDEQKDKYGNVLPGIGGEVYRRLGLETQPAKISGGYMPNLVKQVLFLS